MSVDLGKYADFKSQESIVRNVLISFCEESMGVVCPRSAFSYQKGIISIKSTPLVKRYLVQQKSTITALLEKEGVPVFKIL